MTAFLELPTECRLQIYRGLLDSRHPSSPPMRLDSARRWQTFDYLEYPIQPAILQVNKDIHDEAGTILYGENILHHFVKFEDPHFSPRPLKRHSAHLLSTYTSHHLKKLHLHLYLLEQLSSVWAWPITIQEFVALMIETCAQLSTIPTLRQLQVSAKGRVPGPDHEIVADLVPDNESKTQLLELIQRRYKTLLDPLRLMPDNVSLKRGVVHLTIAEGNYAEEHERVFVACLDEIVSQPRILAK